MVTTDDGVTELRTPLMLRCPLSGLMESSSSGQWLGLATWIQELVVSQEPDVTPE